MSTVAFDTLKFVKTLEASGIEEKQAEAIASAYRDASADQELVTKRDLEITMKNLEITIQKELVPIKTEMQVMKWMTTVVISGIILLLLKSFFPIAI